MAREDIQERLKILRKPLEEEARTKAVSERERKRAVLWNIIETGDDNAKCRALDILNRMDAEYINITKTVNDNGPDISSLDLDALKKLTS